MSLALSKSPAGGSSVIGKNGFIRSHFIQSADHDIDIKTLWSSSDKARQRPR